MGFPQVLPSLGDRVKIKILVSLHPGFFLHTCAVRWCMSETNVSVHILNRRKCPEPIIQEDPVSKSWDPRE